MNVEKILGQFGLQDCAPVHIPLTVKEKLSLSQSPKMDNKWHDLVSMFKNINHLEGVGSLLLARLISILLIGVFTQFGSNPGKPHYEVLKCVLCYLKRTAHFTVTFGGSDSKTNLIGWSDADWAQDLDLMHSIGAFVFNLTSSYLL